jgi:hypothetical protein
MPEARPGKKPIFLKKSYFIVVLRVRLFPANPPAMASADRAQTGFLTAFSTSESIGLLRKPSRPDCFWESRSLPAAADLNLAPDDLLV